MDLSLGPDEEQIMAAAAEILAAEFPLRRLHNPEAAYLNEKSWLTVAENGWLGLTLAQNMGGIGLTPIEAILFFREAGRQLAPVSLLHTSLAAHIAADAGLLELANQFVSGAKHASLAVPREISREAQSGYYFFGAPGADYAIEVRGAGSALHDLSEIELVSLPSWDKSICMSSGALAPAECLARSEGPAISLLGRGGIAAMQLGVSEAVRDMIVEYAKVRETFGRPIGSYQAVRHPCAEMALRCEASRAQLFVAAISLRDGLADAALQINAAKLIANDAAIKNVGTNLQLHGGIGTTDEHDAHLFLKRAHMTARWFGGDKVVLKEILAVPFAA